MKQMPAYDYVCQSCNSTFEVRRKSWEPGPCECPECHTGPVRRVYTPVGMVIKSSTPPCANGSCALETGRDCANAMCGCPMAG